MQKNTGKRSSTRRYSTEEFKSLLSMTEYVKHKREISQWDVIFANAKLLDIGSTSIVKTGNSGSANSILDKIERRDEAAAKNKAYSTIENLIIESFYIIDPQYRIYVYDLYIKPDKRKLRNSPAAEAERYGYDRRKFVPQLNSALDEAVKTSRVTDILDEVRNIALENNIEELINIYAKEEV